MTKANVDKFSSNSSTDPLLRVAISYGCKNRGQAQTPGKGWNDVSLFQKTGNLVLLIFIQGLVIEALIVICNCNCSICNCYKLQFVIVFVLLQIVNSKLIYFTIINL